MKTKEETIEKLREELGQLDLRLTYCGYLSNDDISQIQKVYERYCSLNAKRELPQNPYNAEASKDFLGENVCMMRYVGYDQAQCEMTTPDSEGIVWKPCYDNWEVK